MGVITLERSKTYRILEKTTGGLFPLGSVVEINGETCFWRDFNANKFLFRKGNFVAIYQDDALIKFLETTPVKNMFFRDYHSGKIYKTPLEAYKTAKVIEMRGRKQRGLNISRFEAIQLEKTAGTTRPENTHVIEG